VNTRGICDALTKHLGPDAVALILTAPSGKRSVVAFTGSPDEVIAAYRQAGYTVEIPSAKSRTAA
jgi:hypothetical protein